MANPFKANDRVVVTSDHADKGRMGTVYSVRDDVIMVTLDNDTGAMQWHWSHFEKVNSGMRVLTAAQLVPGNKIFFGQEIVKVIGVERPEGGLVTIVTRSDDSQEWIDYVEPGRKFAAEIE